VPVTYMWVGGVRSATASVAAKVTPTGASCRLAVATDSALTSPVYSTAVAAGSDGWVQVSIAGLAVSTSYFFGIEINGALDATRGKFTTLSTPGSPQSFSFAVASCAVTGATGPTFTNILNRSPLFFAHLGDLHYDNILTNDTTAFVSRYETTLASATQGPLYRNVPIEYVWDDHDFGINDSDRTHPAAPAAAAAFRKCVPAAALAATDGQGIYRSWQVGRAWMIATDLRSYRDPDANADGVNKTMLGITQKAWFKAQLLTARDTGAPAIFWFCSSVWNSKSPYARLDVTDLDHWGSFATERTELANFIRDNDIPPVVALCGDAHQLSQDGSGRNSDFATGGGAPVATFVNSPLEQITANLSRGDKWTQGPVEANKQYGVVTVQDDGASFHWSWQGFTLNDQGREWASASYNGYSRAVTRVWNGSSWVARPHRVWDGAAFTSRQVKVH
jgi:phosphodiesterase/alkaline phosphatase D-like protein